MDAQRRVGPYTLVKKLGEGGMGFVYLAEDPTGRRVALKMMRPELAAREEFRRRFGKEAEAARRVARFCTAPVLDAGFEGGTAYLVTEYVEGPDLSGVVVRQGPLTGSNLEALAVGVATALAAIHQAGVVHRDLKPSNVLLSAVGPRVIDFGIAQLADAGGAPVTIAQSMGTPAYMSPEQAKGEQVTSASDIFSWAALVAYAGIGRPPFGSGGVAEVVYRVINHAPVLDGLDERIRPLVERALDKDPMRRPTAQQLLDRLLGRAEVPVAAATRLVSDTWTPLAPTPPSAAPPFATPSSAIPSLASPASATTPGATRPDSRFDGPSAGSLGGPSAVVPAGSSAGAVKGPSAGPLAGPSAGAGEGPPAGAGEGPFGGRRAAGRASGRRRWLGPVVAAALAAVLGVGATLAVLRPWQERVAEPGTPAVTRTLDALDTTFQVRIDSLVRQGTTARLQWTVKNVGKNNAPLYDRFGASTLDNTVSRISIVPPGVGKPLYPARKDNACQCAEVPTASFGGGMQLQLWAVFEGVPHDAEHVDVNLGPLGTIKNVALSSA
ncbi:serine/threonine-protein kinase [Nonomuraea sp. NPDC048901]|uniref:serine/threonine-protein kinase n=1 Tax=Nonomuraea sp. NPDC048901 TaxID=3155627 RepID=UPI0033DE4A45